MKVYIMTQAKPFHAELYIGVRKSLKEAEKALRNNYPHMKPVGNMSDGIKNYVSDASNSLIFVSPKNMKLPILAFLIFKSANLTQLANA